MKKMIMLSAFALILALPLTSVAKVNHHATKATNMSATVAADGQVDINKADANALTKVKGIGPKRAQAIIDYRQQHGAFKSMADLTNVKGFSRKTAEKIRK